MPFLTPIETRRISKRLVRLLSDLIYLDKAGRRWIVPRGFECDLDSRPTWIPGLLDWWMGTQTAASQAAALHDWLYRTGVVSKRESDRLFWEALESDDIGPVGSWLFWAGVAVGGHWAWWKNRRAQKRAKR